MVFLRLTRRTALRDPGGAGPVIPGRINRKRRIAYDTRRYRDRDRHLIENAFSWLKDSCRLATRYDTLARSFLSAVALPH